MTVTIFAVGTIMVLTLSRFYRDSHFYTRTYPLVLDYECKYKVI